MKNIRAYLTVLFVAISVLLQSEIIEIEHMSEIKEFIDRDSLVVFDIDNTLIEPVQELGNDQWFRYRMNQLMDEGKSVNEALEQAVLDWEAIRNVTEMKLVETEAAPIIEELQAAKQPVIGLTTQSFSLALRTTDHLNKLGIDLNATAVCHEPVMFLLDLPILYLNGILFTNGCHKGKALDKFLLEARFNPKKIVFINDKKSHLHPVEEFCREKNISFVGLRYGYLDKKVESFDPTVAEVQWQHFGKILSDVEARAERLPKE